MITTASMLPTEAVIALKKAANTPITQKDPNARVKAIERAIGYVRREYPDRFRNDHDGSSE